MLEYSFCEKEKILELSKDDLFGNKCLSTIDYSILDTEETINLISKNNDIKTLTLDKVFSLILPILPDENYYKDLLYNKIKGRKNDDFIDEKTNKEDYFFWNKQEGQRKNILLESQNNENLKDLIVIDKDYNSLMKKEHHLIKKYFFSKVSLLLSNIKFENFYKFYPDIFQEYSYKYDKYNNLIKEKYFKYFKTNLGNENILLNIFPLIDKKILINKLLEININDDIINEILIGLYKINLHNLKNTRLISQMKEKGWFPIFNKETEFTVGGKNNLLENNILNFAKKNKNLETISGKASTFIEQLTSFFSFRKNIKREKLNVYKLKNTNDDTNHIIGYYS